MVKQLLRYPFRLLGYDVIRQGVTANPLQTVADLLKGRERPTLFDVGANVGQTALQLLSHFPTASVYSFEPDPVAFQALTIATAGNSRARAFPYALGARDESKRFTLNSDSVTNSFLPSSVDPKSVTQGHGSYQVRDVIDVRVRRITDVAAELALDRIDLLKIDAQGHDLQVLTGAEELLVRKAIHLIFVEVMFVPFYDGQCHFDEIVAYLRLRGYNWWIFTIRTYTAIAAYFRPTLSSCPHEIHDLVVEPYTF